MKIIHSADWQLGKRFVQFGQEKAESLRAARLATLGAMLRAARDKGADAIIIAGDLFEDNHVADSVVQSALDLFREFDGVPIFILPGNHDPYTGPDCVWSRRFANAPGHIKVLTEAQHLKFGEVYFVASPLKQKVSPTDPSLLMKDLCKALPEHAVKIGITHGSPAIEGRHRENDFPIHLEAATRASLDYLAIGHWHDWHVFDRDRVVMPGTPEPESFENSDCGYVSCFEITGRGVPPKIEKVPISTLGWVSLRFDFLDPVNSIRLAQESVERTGRALDKLIVRVVLTGNATPAHVKATTELLNSEFGGAHALRIENDTAPTLSAAELAELKDKHPLLAQIFSDLDYLEHRVAEAPKPEGLEEAVSVDEARALAEKFKLDLLSLKAGDFKLARQLLVLKITEAAQ